MQREYTHQTKNSRTFRPQTLSTSAGLESPPPANAAPVQTWRNGGGVYDALLVMLESRKVTNVTTAEIFYSIDPAIRRQAAELHGIAEAEIYRQDAETVRGLGDHPKYFTTRSVPLVLWNQFERDGLTDFVWDRHVVQIPNDLTNRLICRELEAIYGRAEVLKWSGFIVDYHDYDRQILLNINPKYAAAGFMVPIFRPDGHIEGFWCYRHPKDAKRFKLSSKREGIADA